ncbi:MAG: Stp1/IreP family PP2C-type Ser/Thr phosphatase [Bacteroidetes bacterium]|nr:Stp1/IreP family PP2C-type Ser/Thr phosphatase [Bacteroidota bacterium]
MSRIRYGWLTHQGMVRSENQDALGVSPDHDLALDHPKGVLFVVADGMGGHRAGRRASELAVSTVISSYAGAESTDIPAILPSAVREANRLVYHEGSSTPAYHGMGTTCTALVLQGTSAWVAHVGDSKAFLISSEGISQITTDHSRVWELYTRGVISREEARIHPERNLLTRALGQRPETDVDLVGPLTIRPGWKFLLCTDGLTNHVEEKELREAVMRTTPAEGAAELIALANTRGGADNISVQIVEILAD